MEETEGGRLGVCAPAATDSSWPARGNRRAHTDLARSPLGRYVRDPPARGGSFYRGETQGHGQGEDISRVSFIVPAFPCARTSAVV